MSWLHKSTSQWEDSYFGGFVRILLDYPELKIPWEIDTETPKEKCKELTSYTKDKLLGLFQMKIAEYNLLGYFLAGARMEQRISGWLGKKKHFLVPNEAGIVFALNQVIANDTELASLFDHYKGLIKSTSFLYPYQPPKDSNWEDDGDDDGDGEQEEKEGEKGKEKEGKEKKEKEKEEKQKEKEANKKGKEGKGKDEKEGKEGEKGKEKEGKQGEGNKEEKKDEEKRGGTPGGEGVSPAKMLEEATKTASILIKEISKRKPYSGWSGSVSGDLKKRTKFKLIHPVMGRVKYTENEKLLAARLVNMLDISFDPASDKVGNLRNGKLDTGKLGSVPAGNHHVYYTVEENQTTKPFSVCILADESGSMVSGPTIATSNQLRQHSLLKVLYKAFSQIIPPNKIYVYGHSGMSTPVVRIYNDNYNQVFEDTINDQLLQEFKQNYDGPVIESIYERIRGVTSDNIIFISISDGMPSGESYGGEAAVRDLKRVIEKCKRDGFVTVGVGVNYGLVREIYSYNTIVTDLSQMAKQVSLVVNQVVKTEFQS